MFRLMMDGLNPTCK